MRLLMIVISMCISLTDVTVVDNQIKMNGLDVELASDKSFVYKDDYYIHLDDLESIFREAYHEEALVVLNLTSRYVSLDDVATELGFTIEKDNINHTVNIYKSLSKEEKEIVAHGGGHLDYYTLYVTNTEDALNFSYSKGIKLFELDFIWTTDDYPVVSHDWWIISQFSDVPYIEEGYSLEEYLEFELWYEWKQLTLETLFAWLEDHPDAFIVSDVKNSNLEFLSLIKETYPMFQKRFIPQVYSRDGYHAAKALGYDDIIFTLYKTFDSNDVIYEFALDNDVIVTMDEERVLSGLGDMLDAIGVFTYCHTINDGELAKVYRSKGIDGFYSDNMSVEERTYEGSER